MPLQAQQADNSATSFPFALSLLPFAPQHNPYWRATLEPTTFFSSPTLHCFLPGRRHTNTSCRLPPCLYRIATCLGEEIISSQRIQPNDDYDGAVVPRITFLPNPRPATTSSSILPCLIARTRADQAPPHQGCLSAAFFVTIIRVQGCGRTTTHQRARKTLVGVVCASIRHIINKKTKK